MKVLHISPTYFSSESHLGGGERYAQELARAMAASIKQQSFNKGSVKLISFGKKGETRELEDLKLEIYPYWFLYQGNLGNPVNLTFLKEFFWADIIHCHQIYTMPTSFAVLAAKLLGKKVFVTDSGSRLKSLINKLNLFNKIDGFLLLSKFSASLANAPKDKTRLIYGGVDVEKFKPVDPEAKEDYVVCVSRILPHKGINYLVEGIEPAVPLKIVGAYADKGFLNDLKKLARGKKVEFIHDATDEELVDYYQKALVAVQPSVYQDMYGKTYKDPELLGLTTLESMACGTPVVVTQVGSLPELVSEEVGFVLPPNDAGIIGRTINHLVEDRGLAVQMGRNARRRVLQNFTWDEVVSKCLQAYLALRAR